MIQVLDRSQFAQLAIWTKKFAAPLLRLTNTSLQKISATDKGEIILSVYKPQDDRSIVLLSMKKGESGISLTHNRPVTLKQPNSFVQITRKYLQNRKVSAAYATISPICIVLEFSDPPSHAENEQELKEGPNALILDLDAKPPRLVLARQTSFIPERYQSQCGKRFSQAQTFFESWCEWSEEYTKTKKRACFVSPIIGYCPLSSRDEPVGENVGARLVCLDPQVEPRNDPINEGNDINGALSYLPTHIRRSARTKLQFLERRLHRQKSDLPTDSELLRLQKQTQGLKSHLYLWPNNSLIWYVPPQFIEEFNLNPIYTLKKGDKPSSLLTALFHQIDILERRKVELIKRMIESESSLEKFQNLLIESTTQLKIEVNNYLEKNYLKQDPASKSRDDKPLQDKNKIEKKAIDFVISRKEIPALQQLCKYLGIELVESEQVKKLKIEKEERLPYRSFTTSTGQFIRVARSASDGELMIKLMPSNHYWFHVLTGEGSHIWLEKLKGEKKPSPTALREAGILAVHHSKHSRAQDAEVQFATRADIEKKKNLAIGKVLVRRCETFIIRYDDDELKKIIEGKS